MPEIPRLNPAIRALESGKPAFVTFSPAEIGAAQSVGAAGYDAVVFEMEHNPYDIRQLRDCMQYMLDRAQILKSGSLAPAVAPMVRIPPNGGELNQFIAKQVLDIGVYGIVWPHVSTVEEARNAVQACRYPRPREAKFYEPAGQRGDAPRTAARYWGISQPDYYKRADTWPLNPEGEVLVVIMCEEKRAIRNLPQMLKEVPGIGVVLIGEGDLSQDMGYPRQYDHPEVAAAIDDILAICKDHGIPCGHPHVDANNVEKLVEKGFRWLMPAPSQSFAALDNGLKAAGRKKGYPFGARLLRCARNDSICCHCEERSDEAISVKQPRGLRHHPLLPALPVFCESDLLHKDANPVGRIKMKDFGVRLFDGG